MAFRPPFKPPERIPAILAAEATARKLQPVSMEIAGSGRIACTCQTASTPIKRLTLGFDYTVGRYYEVRY